MNVFGFTIQTKKQLAATLAAVSAPMPEVNDDRPESVQFGEEYNRGSAREGIDGLKDAGRDADRNSKMALYVTIPHAALYMLGLVNWDFSTPLKAGSVLCEIAICLAVPYGLDRLALANCRTLGMRIASTWSKVRAFALLLIALPASMALNFAAPSHIVIRAGAAGLVMMVGLYQVARLVSPSFARMGADELKRQAELDQIQRAADAAGKSQTVAAPASTSRKPDAAELAARKRDHYSTKDAAGKLAWTRDYRRKVDERAVRDAAKALKNINTSGDLIEAAGPLADAPVSGAPVQV